jgi:integrase
MVIGQLLGFVGRRVNDVDLDRLEIRVRRGKGARDRVTMLPTSLVDPLRAHRDAAKEAMQRRWARDRGYVVLPFAHGTKAVCATRNPTWCWLFPAAREYGDAGARQWRTRSPLDLDTPGMQPSPLRPSRRG